MIFRDGAFLFYFLVFKFPAKILNTSAVECERALHLCLSLVKKPTALTATVNIDRLLIDFFFLLPRSPLSNAFSVRVTPRHITRTFHSALLLFADDQKKR